MFRKLTRFKQQLPPEECAELLARQRRGVLSVLGDGGYPYGLPMDHWYCPEDGHLYFHSGRSGHKVDAVARCDKVSYCVIDGGSPIEGDWALRFRSVIVFGRIRPVEDYGRAMDIARRLSLCFTQDEAYIEADIRKNGPATLIWELMPEHITGKRVTES